MQTNVHVDCTLLIFSTIWTGSYHVSKFSHPLTTSTLYHCSSVSSQFLCPEFVCCGPWVCHLPSAGLIGYDGPVFCPHVAERTPMRPWGKACYLMRPCKVDGWWLVADMILSITSLALCGNFSVGKDKPQGQPPLAVAHPLDTGKQALFLWNIWWKVKH